MGFLWTGSKKSKEEEVVTCASCDKLVLKDRAIEVSETRFEYWDRAKLGEAHTAQSSFTHFCCECDPGYTTKIVTPDGDCHYYWYGYADVNGRNRNGWHEVV